MPRPAGEEARAADDRRYPRSDRFADQRDCNRSIAAQRGKAGSSPTGKLTAQARRLDAQQSLDRWGC